MAKANPAIGALRDSCLEDDLQCIKQFNYGCLPRLAPPVSVLFSLNSLLTDTLGFGLGLGFASDLPPKLEHRLL